MDSSQSKNQSRLTWIVLGVHVIISVLMLLFYGTGHPLLRFMKSWATEYQLLLTCLSGFIIYSVAGYFLMLSFGNRTRTFKSIRRGLVILSTILLLVFIGVFVYTYFLYAPAAWLIYSLINPVFGNVLLETATRSLWMLLWLPSAFLPALGLLMGMFIHTRQGDKVQ